MIHVSQTFLMFRFTSSFLLLVAIFLFTAGNAGADQKYRVAKGDNLSKIGRNFGVPYKQIMAANRLKSTVIYPNQILVIPSPASRTVPSASAVPVPSVKARPSAPSVPREKVRELARINERVKAPKPPPITEEDPLGLGIRTSPYRNNTVPNDPAQPLKPFASARKIETPVSPTVEPFVDTKKVSPFRRSREVPAVAHYPEGPVRSFKLDPQKYPTPSFSTPQPLPKKRVSPGGCRTYTVRSGDSVWNISRRFGVSPLKLRRMNGLGLGRVRSGMQLTIPPSSGIWSL